MADLILDEALELGSALPIVLTSSTRMARMNEREGKFKVTHGPERASLESWSMTSAGPEFDTSDSPACQKVWR
jgi:hypothetical protein